MDRVNAQRALEAGKLHEAIAEINPNGKGWLLELADECGHRELLTDAHQRAKVFHGLDQASREAIDIGFHGLRIDDRQ